MEWGSSSPLVSPLLKGSPAPCWGWPVLTRRIKQIPRSSLNSSREPSQNFFLQEVGERKIVLCRIQKKGGQGAPHPQA